ncbi:hypothetical protein LCGC14_1979190 [marine sediment metagenome]|uniref:Uncharacterized protein n=1 Tax=marine sediment metagenome TaxID=412755 RepID=A0A0F9FXN1_9ZZZZ
MKDSQPEEKGSEKEEQEDYRRKYLVELLILNMDRRF